MRTVTEGKILISYLPFFFNYFYSRDVSKKHRVPTDIVCMSRQSTYTETMLRDAIDKSVSFAGVLRELGLKPGGAQAGVIKKAKELNIDYSHFTGQAHLKGKSPSNKLPADKIFRVLPEGSRRLDAHLLRRALEESGVPKKCNHCSLEGIWNGKFLQLEINHIDGNYLNCLLDNLEFICPNCHSQDTYSSHSGK